MDSSSEMAIFVNVVRKGGFSAAARALNRTPSAISKQITRLEDRLDVRLLNRTTRQLSMTDEGEAYYHRATAILADIAETEALVSNKSAAPRGLLRVTCSTTFGRQQIVPIYPIFWPAIPISNFNCRSTTRWSILFRKDSMSPSAWRNCTIHPWSRAGWRWTGG